MSSQRTADWLNIMERCLHHILQEIIRKVHSKTSGYGPFQFEAPVMVSSTLQTCVALRRGYVLRNAPLGDCVVVRTS
jgi:hypothetical protein